MIHKPDGGFFDKVNDENSIGGYPHSLGEEVHDQVGGIFVGSDVPSNIAALRLAGHLPSDDEQQIDS